MEVILESSYELTSATLQRHRRPYSVLSTHRLKTVEADYDEEAVEFLWGRYHAAILA